MNTVAVIVPNWNGQEFIKDCLDSLKQQSVEHSVIVVENGSIDQSIEIIETHFPEITLLKQPKNLGFAGGVNVGIRHAIDQGFAYVALLNNDAVADKHWLKELLAAAKDKYTGSVMSKIKSFDGNTLDGTGEIFTTWGIHFPRGRKEIDKGQYDKDTVIFGASGGSGLFSVKALKQVGLFDEDFFAYYEDIDLAWRLQLAGWKSIFAPRAVVYHRIGGTSGKIKGFTTYQTIKNLPWVITKNIPVALWWKIVPRFLFAYTMFVASAISRGQFIPVLKGVFISTILTPKKIWQRIKIQRRRKSSSKYLLSLLWNDLPPDQEKLRKLRSFFTRKD